MATAPTLIESLADIEALAHRVTWELMDEAQRDEFMEKIVVPRWGRTTSDGVLLKGTAWARLIGTTGESIRNRYKRLKARSEADSGRATTDGPSETEKADIRGARSAMRRHPDLLAKELLADPTVQETIIEAIAADPAIATKVDRKRDEATPPKQNREPQPRDYDKLVDQGVNLITVALAAESSKKWEPGELAEALLYFLGQQLVDRQMPTNLNTPLEEIEAYANRGLR